MCRPASLGTTPSLIPTRSPKSAISTPESAALATATLAATLPATVASSALSTLSTLSTAVAPAFAYTRAAPTLALAASSSAYPDPVAAVRRAEARRAMLLQD